LDPWKAEELGAEFVSHLEKLGINTASRTIVPETVLKNCKNDWNAVKKALLEGGGTPAEKAAGAFFMEKMTSFRRTTDDLLLKESIAAVEARHGIQGKHSSEAVGSTALTSDLDYSIKGPHAEEVIQEFNQRFRTKYNAESGVVFDTNAYTNPSFLEYPIHPDPTNPAKTIDVVPLNAAAKDSTGGLEAWKKFETDTLSAARSAEEKARLNTLMQEAEKLYPHDLGARLRHVSNYQQDVASHITACENFMSHGADGPQQWAKYQEDLLAKTPADKKEALQRVFKEAESKAKGYQSDVREKLKQLYPDKTFTDAEIAEMAHSKDPAKMEMYLAARNRLYEDKLKGVAELKELYAKATTEAEKMAIAAQIHAKQSEALYFASEAYQTSGSILSVVQNAQKAGQKVLDPAYGSLVAAQSRAAFFEQYGKAMSYGADLEGVMKAGKYTERSAYAVMAHPLAAGQGMPKAIETAKGLGALKGRPEKEVLEFLQKSYPEAKDLGEALKMHHGAMASARNELAGRMMEMSGRPLPDIQLAWEKLGEGGNTVPITRLLSLLNQAAAADEE
jgi:hypothetical protein